VRGLLAKLRIDLYLLTIVGMVVLASILPARGEAAHWVGIATKIGVALVFFLHGAKLSREAVLAGILHWRLHLLVLAITFVLFPVVGVGLARLPAWIVPAALAPGLIYLTLLPSTIQSAISCTAIARGNVAAAVCGASVSNLLGIFLTPLLAGLLLREAGGALDANSVRSILMQLLAPFMAGQLLRPLIGGFMQRHAKPLSLVDRGSILLVVYSAFSAAVVAGIWSHVAAADLARILVICLMLLGGSMALALWASRRRGFPVEDEAAILFAACNKSLAAGAPMAAVLFPPAVIGFVLLPVMLYHQAQLMVCAALAQRYAKRAAL
jgi:solute carrier family 10 (sodium/bile acid cotransporter), member 7